MPLRRLAARRSLRIRVDSYPNHRLGRLATTHHRNRLHLQQSNVPVYSLRVENRARKGTMAEIRVKVLSALVTLAENNPLFREEAIDNLENTIRDWGFILTAEETEGVQAHYRLAGMSDADILRELVRLHRGSPGFPGVQRK
jgi:hypothetical protein